MVLIANYTNDKNVKCLYCFYCVWYDFVVAGFFCHNLWLKWMVTSWTSAAKRPLYRKIYATDKPTGIGVYFQKETHASTHYLLEIKIVFLEAMMYSTLKRSIKNCLFSPYIYSLTCNKTCFVAHIPDLKCKILLKLKLKHGNSDNISHVPILVWMRLYAAV